MFGTQSLDMTIVLGEMLYTLEVGHLLSLRLHILITREGRQDGVILLPWRPLLYYPKPWAGLCVVIVLITVRNLFTMLLLPERLPLGTGWGRYGHGIGVWPYLVFGARVGMCSRAG